MSRKTLLLGLAICVVPDAALAQVTEDRNSDIAALRDEVRQLREEVAALKAEKQIAVTREPVSATWKGAPVFEDKESGFSFKPKGTIQLDAGYVSIPGGANGTVGAGSFGASGVNSNNLGFNTRLRSAIIGAEGSLPGGFGYNVEVDLAQSNIGYEDIILSWRPKGSPLQLRLGYQFPLSSLEVMTSRRFLSFTERAGEVDSFNEGRRIGLSGTYAKKDILLSVGMFGEDTANNAFNRTGWQASFRGVWMPKFGDLQAHVGINLQHRVSPRDAQNVRYRQRPFTQVTDQRLIDTGRIAADGDDIVGIEMAAIYKSVHFSAEAQRVSVRGYQNSNRIFGVNNGTGGTAAFLSTDPSFVSGYAELGWFITGESRGYGNGRWDRTKVLKPVGKSGFGAVQANIRFDRNDLHSGTVDGGVLNGYGASLVWLSTDYVKFIAQYYRIDVRGGPAAVPPFTETADDNSFKIDSFGLRAQVDF